MAKKSKERSKRQVEGDNENGKIEKVKKEEHQINEQANLNDSSVDFKCETEVAQKKRKKQNNKWNRRFRFFFCCLGYKKNKDSIAEVASIFADYYSDLNVRSTDMAAGSILLSKYQEAQRRWLVENEQVSGIKEYLSGQAIKNDTEFLNISLSAKDSHLINDLIYYMNYSSAIFGWPLHVLDDPSMLCCICPYLRLSSCCRRSGRKKPNKEASAGNNDNGDNTNEANNDDQELSTKEGDGKEKEKKKEKKTKRKKKEEKIVGELSDEAPIILQDNCFNCNSASVELRLKAHNYEIIYVNYKDKIDIVPFLVVADHAKQTIVVAIRGSMSLSDMVTDLNGVGVPIPGYPEDWLCHRGMIRAANYVKKTLLDDEILFRAFNCRPDLDSQDYNLILCGHSLGAGVAAILGILLRNLYPNLKAYLYSPPGGCLTKPAMEYTKEFAIGIILGNDVVCQLGLAQLEKLRYHILLSLKTSQKSSFKILFKTLLSNVCVCCCCFNLKNNLEFDYDPTKSIDLLFGNQANPFDFDGNKIYFQIQKNPLYVPGKLIHIVKNYNFNLTKSNSNSKKPIYQAIYSDNLNYDRIQINDGMLDDHLPYNLMRAMKMLFSKTLPNVKSSTKTTKCPSLNKNLPSAVSSSNALDNSTSDASCKYKVSTKLEVFSADDPNNNHQHIDFNRSDTNGKQSINSSKSDHTEEKTKIQSSSLSVDSSIGTTGSDSSITDDEYMSQAKEQVLDDNGNDINYMNNNHC